MHERHSQQTARPEVQEGGVAAEERRVGKLEQGPREGAGDGRVWVRDAEFVEVVDVGEAEDDGGEEDYCGVGGAG